MAPAAGPGNSPDGDETPKSWWNGPVLDTMFAGEDALPAMRPKG
jgi:hypothetical protein